MDCINLIAINVLTLTALTNTHVKLAELKRSSLCMSIYISGGCHFLCCSYCANLVMMS